MNSQKRAELLKNNKDSLESIEGLVDDIATDIADQVKTKIVFNAKLTDGTNNYLDRIDYTSAPINFSWQNDKGSKVYIYKYSFAYTEPAEPTSGQLYHSDAWETKIGALNTAETDYEAPYITKSNNRDYYQDHNPNHAKMSWTSDTGFVFVNDFTNAPIEIGVSRKFGHYIAGDFSSTEIYDTNPVGTVTGFYFDT